MTDLIHAPDWPADRVAEARLLGLIVDTRRPVRARRNDADEVQR